MARETLTPGQVGTIRTDAYDRQGQKLTDGNTTRPDYFQAVAYYGAGDGTRKRKKARGASRTAAERALRKAVREAVQAEQERVQDEARGKSIPREWSAFAVNHREWIESADSDYSAGSRRVYLGALNGYVLQDRPTKKDEEPVPHRFDGRRLDSISHGELKDWLQDIANDRGDGVVHTVQSLTGKMFGRAMDYDIVHRDPTRRIGKVKRKRETVQRLQREAVAKAEAEGKAAPVAKDHEKALAADDITRLFAHLEGDAKSQRNGLHLIAYTMFTTGLRIGEVLALQWQDVDLKGSTLAVDATVVRTPGEGLHLQPWTKTDTGMRTVPMSPDLAEKLRSVKAKDRERARLEESWNPLGLVFPSERGTIRDTSNVHNRFRPAFDAVGLQWATPHTFRRTYATTLLKAGVPVLTVAALLGHTDPSLTLKVYGDWKSAPDVSGTVVGDLLKIEAEKALEGTVEEAK
ncbi:tyrosine-type recombinase/integrase [Brachybacterium paraconglomeratum]|uniref:tyrosine-type recombinase/integrase n=1 Tax=Brachybacterium paraconglomeratum TaxID=173362 RepID=UPI003515FD9D